MKAVDYFNKIAPNYVTWYDTDGYSSYFFKGRMVKSVERINYKTTKILDIGAGTGDLYQYLTNLNGNPINYLGIDISQEMLNNSNIPNENRLCADIFSYAAIQNFDVIFCLGVVAYLDKRSLDEIFDKIYNLLSDNGVVILSISNKNSLSMWINEKFSNSNFKIQKYTEKDVFSVISNKFNPIQITYHDHTIWPLSILLPQCYIYFSEYIGKYFLKSNWYSNEIIFKLEKIPLSIK